MDDFTPFLQIIHISDLHVTNPKASEAIALRAWMRRLRKVLPASLIAAIEDGLAPHDQLAFNLFKDFLQKLICQDPVWSKCKTWLVDTGDLTSMGDKDSLTLGMQVLSDLTKLCPELVSIYGNHDAWPGKPPAWAARADVALQKKALTGLKYNVDVPKLSLQANVPNGSVVQLYALDSVSHNRWQNLMALGGISDKQLSAFATLVDENYKPNQRQFRILAVHHPVHYPPPRPHFEMSMWNDGHVATVLHTPSQKGAYPLAHLVMSGHTHFLYPQHGALPAQPSLCVHPDLSDDQCQFVVGTLMQLDKYNKRHGWPHQCEILRLYYSPTNDSVLLMERLLAARQAGPDYPGAGIGPYRFVQLSEGLGEEITFTL